MKRSVCLMMALMMLLCGCAAAPADPSRETMGYTDSLGRETAVPGNVQRIAVTGPLSHVYVLPLAGDLLVGVSNASATVLPPRQSGFSYSIGSLLSTLKTLRHSENPLE